MKRFKTQQAFFALIMLAVSVFLFTGCGSSDEAALVAAQFDSVLPGPDTCSEEGPRVLSSAPADGDADMPLNTTITATFSEAMDPDKIEVTDSAQPEWETFTIYDNDHPLINIPGTVAMDLTNTIATFTPDNFLEGGTTYTVTITKIATDAGGTPLGCNYRWEFQTITP